VFVNTNVAALNAWLNLDNTQNDMTQVLQQLSSGLKINSAADNPSGLAIAQQMQSEISGMGQAYQNAQSAINLFQTADSALGQVQNILQSMRSLASQAATATENPTDLQALQSEMNQYAQQITQITNDTNFNTLNLLGGGFANESIQLGPDQGQNLAVSISAADAYSLGVTGLSTTVTTPGQIAAAGALPGGNTISAVGVPTGSYTVGASTTPWSLSNISVSNATPANDSFTLTGNYASSVADSVSITYNSSTSISVTDTATGQTVNYSTGTANQFSGVSINGSTMSINFNGSTAPSVGDVIQFTVNPTSTTETVQQSSNTVGTSTVYGAIASDAQQSVNVGTGAISFDASGLLSGNTDSALYSASYTGSGTTAANAGTPSALTPTAFSVAQSGSAASSYSNGTGNAVATTGVDITTLAGAEAALTVLGNAINTVSEQRATIGAYQNRLTFAASDLQSSQQNLTAARAQITNADLAMGMSQLTKDQILQQAGVGMLAQANAMPQALLKLIP